MSEVTRHTIFAQAAKKLRQDFEELSTVPHNQLKGGEAERLIRHFLNQHLPKRFAAGAGFIIDPRDKISPQQDVVIYDAYNCPVYRASEEAGIFPSNNVAAVVEVKSVLDKEKLYDALTKIAVVKSLAKVKTRENIGRFVMDQTLGCIFAFDSSITLETITEHYRQWFVSNALGLHADILAVLDKGIVSLAASVKGHPGWRPIIMEGLGGEAAEGSHIGLSTQTLGERTLDVFLRLMLVQLSVFREMVDHPGFGCADSVPNKMQQITYLTSLTMENDPEKRKLKLKQYAEEVKTEFAKSPLLPNWPKVKVGLSEPNKNED